MPLKRYRVIVKVLCPSCAESKKRGVLGMNCPHCQFIKYNNVTHLVKFTSYIDEKYPDWVWFRVYEYVKGEQGRELKTYKNWYKTYIRDGKKWICTGTTRDIPSCDQI